MSKRQRLSDPESQFEDLPDEVILKILGYLEGTKGLIYCGHLSSRIRTISQDETLWQKINLSRQNIPTGFLQLVLNNGCKYLTLRSSYIHNNHGIVKLNMPNQLRYLDLTNTTSSSDEVLDELLESCCSLEKLSVKYFKTSLVDRFCQQNWKSLKLLNFKSGLDMESINYSSYLKTVVKICVELKELNVRLTDLSEDVVDFLVNNLTPKIEKLNLFSMAKANDEQIKTLVERCNKITSLHLRSSTFTDDSITRIIQNLKVIY